MPVLTAFNQIFPEILKYNKSTFFSSLQRYILINLSPKNISFPNGTLDKILKIIEIHYYTKDYRKITNLINYFILINKSALRSPPTENISLVCISSSLAKK